MQNTIEFDIDVKHHQRKCGNQNFQSNLNAYSCDKIGIPENKVKDLTLVIVGEDKYLRKYINNTLSLSYNCFEARNGRQGFGLISRLIPDMVISEVNMTKMDGYELCERMKGNQKICHIPIILLTDPNAFTQMVNGYNKGADICVARPLLMNVLLALVSRLIKNRDLIKSKYIAHNFMIDMSSSNLTWNETFINQMVQILEENISNSDFSVQELSNKLKMSQTTLFRKVKILTGRSPIEFMMLFKMQKAYKLLSTSESIRSVAKILGFNNSSYFSKCFRKQFDATPMAFRQKCPLRINSGNLKVSDKIYYSV